MKQEDITEFVLAASTTAFSIIAADANGVEQMAALAGYGLWAGQVAST